VSLPPATHPGAVHLSVASLARSLDYYEHAIGLQIRANDGATAHLGAGGDDLLVLTEQPGARPADGFAGLFHFALLVPDRVDLARWLLHAVRDQVQLTGLSDHAVSEALYLRDPDGHGIEIYADRPRAQWEGRVAELLTTLPLDTDDLVATVGDPREATFDGMAAGTVMGHVHLRVADVAATNAFWADTFGFEKMAVLGAQATMLAAGGYHHHLGANTWESRGAGQAPEDRARLLEFELAGADAGASDRLVAAGHEPDADGRFRDPSGNAFRLV
jgi:catechol 2,3-dioxygenase